MNTFCYNARSPVDSTRLGDRPEGVSGAVDVLIATALQDELEALKKVIDGALGDGWREARDRSRG